MKDKMGCLDTVFGTDNHELLKVEYKAYCYTPYVEITFPPILATLVTTIEGKVILRSANVTNKSMLGKQWTMAVPAVFTFMERVPLPYPTCNQHRIAPQTLNLSCPEIWEGAYREEEE